MSKNLSNKEQEYLDFCSSIIEEQKKVEDLCICAIKKLQSLPKTSLVDSALSDVKSIRENSISVYNNLKSSLVDYAHIFNE